MGTCPHPPPSQDSIYLRFWLLITLLFGFCLGRVHHGLIYVAKFIANICQPFRLLIKALLKRLSALLVNPVFLPTPLRIVIHEDIVAQMSDTKMDVPEDFYQTGYPRPIAWVREGFWEFITLRAPHEQLTPPEMRRFAVWLKDTAAWLEAKSARDAKISMGKTKV